MSGHVPLAWHDCRVTASVQGENPGSKGHGQPGWKPQCQAQRTSIPPSAGVACGRSHTNGGSAWNASCVPTVMNSRFRAGEHCGSNSNIQLIHDKNIRLLLLRSLQTAWDLCDRAQSVQWPWTLGSGSSVATMPRSQMAPALTASDSHMRWTWTLCRRGGIAPVRPT